ncbi:MAG: metal-sulfur cluster assembly factor [Chloroflexi bacterium]|nr:metal-sulfur cluster assembly factor [Chloroflexota bacterium]
MSLPTEEQVIEKLKDVYDPELGLNIVDLGLVYGVDPMPDDEKVNVRMTLTSPGCPYGPMLMGQVHTTILTEFPDVKDVSIDLQWSPPWDPREMASEEVKMMLGIW